MIPVGNRVVSFLSAAYVHDNANRLLEDDQFTYTYDANGNLETKTDKINPTQVTTYQWDAQNQLIRIDFPDGATATYKYDGLGRRIEKNVNGTITRYVYDGENILLEYDGSNTFKARYSHGERIDQPLAVQRAGLGFFYYHADHQGSIRNLTDSSGAIVNAYDYDAYGRMMTTSVSVPNPFTYTGRERDAESGLYYYRARYYNPQTGRFLSEDPISFAAGDTNLYRYVFNNPVNLIDPTGLIQVPGMPFFDPGLGGGFGPRSGSFRSRANPGGKPASKNQAMRDLAGERARDLIKELTREAAEGFERARERMNEPNPNPVTEIICPRGNLCEKREKPKDRDANCS